MITTSARRPGIGQRQHHHLTLTGCQASGFISDDNLVTAVRAETRIHYYDQVILVAGRQPCTWLARAFRRDPAHKLRPHLGQRRITFPLGQARRAPRLRLRPDRRATPATGRHLPAPAPIKDRETGFRVDAADG